MGSSLHRDWTHISYVPVLTGGFFTTSGTWEAQLFFTVLKIVLCEVWCGEGRNLENCVFEYVSLFFLAISVVILPHVIGWLLVSFLLFLSFTHYVIVGLFRSLFILLDSWDSQEKGVCVTHLEENKDSVDTRWINIFHSDPLEVL